jgi:hypothetical protein
MPAMAVPVAPINIPITGLSVKLSAIKMSPDDHLNISVIVALDLSGYSNWTPYGQNASPPPNVRLPTAMFMISHVSSGNVVAMTTKNVSIDGRAYYNYTPQRPVRFGPYTVWVTVSNRSAFASFSMEPSPMDLINQMTAMQELNQKAVEKQAFVVNFGFPFILLVSFMTILLAYWQWRIPDPTKQEIKYWIMSKMDQSKLERLLADVRDVDRKGYARRQTPTIYRTDREIVKLHKKQYWLKKLADSVDKRLKRYEKRIEVGDEFVTTLRILVDDLGTRMARLDRDAEKALDNLQVRALEQNKRTLIDTSLGERDMNIGRVRRTSSRMPDLRGREE